MSEMVERVARVLCAAEYGDSNAEYNGMPLWRNYADTAREVIAAMREPTGAMVDAMDGERDYSGYTSPRNSWEAAIDAALK